MKTSLPLSVTAPSSGSGRNWLPSTSSNSCAGFTPPTALICATVWRPRWIENGLLLMVMDTSGPVSEWSVLPF
jgi:hypothetical protein